MATDGLRREPLLPELGNEAGWRLDVLLFFVAFVAVAAAGGGDDNSGDDKIDDEDCNRRFWIVVVAFPRVLLVPRLPWLLLPLLLPLLSGLLLRLALVALAFRSSSSVS